MRQRARNMTLTAEQCRGARGLLGWGKRELAERTGISPRTVQRLEEGPLRPMQRTVDDIARVLRDAGVLFIPPVEGEHRGGVALRCEQDVNLP